NKVIVAVDEGLIGIAARHVGGAMHKNALGGEASAEICGRGAGRVDVQGGGAVGVFVGLRRGVGAQFKESSGGNGGGGRIARVVAAILGNIPIGNEVGGKIGEEIVGQVLRGGEKARVFGVTIGHRKAINGPSLPARPSTVVTRALPGESTDDISVVVVVDDVKGAAVRADVIVHRFYGMVDGPFVPVGIAAILRREKG